MRATLDTAEVCGLTLRETLDDVLEIQRLGSSPHVPMALVETDLARALKTYCTVALARHQRRLAHLGGSSAPSDTDKTQSSRSLTPPPATMSMELEGRPSWTAMVSAPALRRIVLSVLDNALKFCAAPGTIRVRMVLVDVEAETGAATVDIVVEDQGIGMDEAFVKVRLRPSQSALTRAGGLVEAVRPSDVQVLWRGSGHANQCGVDSSPGRRHRRSERRRTGHECVRTVASAELTFCSGDRVDPGQAVRSSRRDRLVPTGDHADRASPGRSSLRQHPPRQPAHGSADVAAVQFELAVAGGQLAQIARALCGRLERRAQAAHRAVRQARRRLRVGRGRSAGRGQVSRGAFRCASITAGARADACRSC